MKQNKIPKDNSDIMANFWDMYLKTKDISYLAAAAEKAPFFGQKEMSNKIGSLIRKQKKNNINLNKKRYSFPNRIVCLTEETTEVLYDLGAEDLIVGISGYTVRPQKARQEKPKVSAFQSAKIDKIVSLNPDLVLGFSDIQADICSELIRRGINVHCFNQRSLIEIFHMIEFLSRLVDLKDRGYKYINLLQNGLDRITKKSKSFRLRPKVYFEEWDQPMISGIKWVSELISLAGGNDIFADLSQESLAKNRIIKNPQIVIERNPDIIIASWCGKKVNKEKIIKREGWDKITAIKKNRIYEIKSPVILQPGPAALKVGVKELHKIFFEWQNQ